MDFLTETIPKLLGRRTPKNTEDGVTFWKKVGRHKIYKFENFDHMSVYRELGVRKGYGEFELGVRYADLMAYVDVQTELFNKGNTAGAIAALDHLRMMSTRYMSERITLEIGGWGVLIDNENWQRPTSKDIAKKVKLLHDPEVRAFFLTNALRYLSILSVDMNVSNVEKSLKNPERAKREGLFLALISTTLYDGLWSDLMPNPYG